MRLIAALLLMMLCAGCDALLVLQTCCYFSEVPHMCYCPPKGDIPK